MASDFKVRGRALDAAEMSGAGLDEASGASDGFGYTLRHEVAVGAAARGMADPVLVDGLDSDVIEIEDVDGWVSFHRAGTLARSHGRSLRGDAALDLLTDIGRGDGLTAISAVRRGTVTLPAHIESALAELNDSLEAMSPFDRVKDFVLGKAIEKSTRKAMEVIVDWIDSPASDDASPKQKRRRPKPPGVYGVGTDLRLRPDQHNVVAADPEPYLMLLHGTFSHTEGAFGGLANTPEWRRLVGHHEGRVVALEHPTLGATPVENAIAAVRNLPGGTRLHLMSHSRGGLVGDVLSYVASQEPHLPYFNAEGHPDADHLRTLRDLVTEKGITVERFVRVACPARGTLLASRRLDRYANYLFNVFRLVPFMAASGLASVVKQVLLTFLDHRTDASVVPGLEAQMPNSPLVRTLNTSKPVDDGLGVVAGDIEGSGIAKRVLVAASDLFYREDHDLVVNTSAMDGGLPRKVAGRSSHQGGDVHHSAYFVNDPSLGAVVGWLTEPALPAAGFEPFGTSLESTAREARRGAVARSATRDGSSAVVIVPDVFGSVLADDGVELWPDVTALARFGVGTVLHPESAAEPTGLVAAYDDLAAHLSSTHQVAPFAYDWRMPVADVAHQLGAFVSELSTPGRPVHIVAHGAGALIALVAAGQAVWTEARARGSRIVLLGDPTGGAWSTVARMAGLDEFAHALAMIDPTLTPERIGRLLSRLPLEVALLPWDEDPSTWERLGNAKPTRRDLARASRVHAAPSDVAAAGITALIGTGTTVDGQPSGDTFEFTLTDAGDGRFTRRPPGAWTRRFAPIAHCRLATDPAAFSSIDQILAGDDPSGLAASSTPDANARPLPDNSQRLLFPSCADLVELALGGTEVSPSQVVSSLRVSVMHGDLARVETPLAVSTYDGTPLDGAEKALDRRLNGALTRRVALGQFPGPLGTYDVIVPDSHTDLWAIVIGLGDNGSLTPAGLSAGVASAALKTAALKLDRTSGGSRTHQTITYSSVLIGTTGAGAMSISSSIAAITEGVMRANQFLADGEYPIHFDHLQFVELYEERAIAAVHAIQDLPDFVRRGRTEGGDLVVEKHLVRGCDGRPGRPEMSYNAGEWITVRIEALADDAPSAFLDLSYTTIGRMARAEQRVTSSQRESLDHLIETSIRQPTVDPQLYNTLYELITPLSMKTQGREIDNLMYVLDEAASTLPLEMLAVRAGGASDAIVPIATRVGMVRRLETSTFRERVRLASGTKALVIGDPPTGKYARLPGARLEARRVADLLRTRGYDVVELISASDEDDSVSVAAIFNALFAHDYRIIHIAGHGAYNEDQTHNGVVLDGDVYLTAAEIEKMQTTPDLVFLNCCHIGSMIPTNLAATEVGPWRPDKLSASISRQMIDNGVRMFVGAGWAVSDVSAAEFAETFYSSMFDGADLGSAALAARARVWHGRRVPGDNTWAAYQVYGPPAAALTTGVRASHELPVRSVREFRERLSALTEQAAASTSAHVEVIRTRAAVLVDEAPDEWSDGESDYLAGALWLEVGDYEAAEKCLSMAVQRWGANAPMRAYELLVNVRAKWAVALTTSDATETADEQFAAAEDLIHAILSLGTTPERLSLLGSYWRRRMQAAPTNALRRAAGDKARSAYRRAADLHRSVMAEPDYYAELNWLALDGVVRLHGRKTDVPPDELALIDQCDERARQERCPTFWSRVAAADSLLVRHILHRSVADNVSTITDAYRHGFEGSSPRQRAAIVEHLRILAAGLPDLHHGPRRDEREALLDIAAALEA